MGQIVHTATGKGYGDQDGVCSEASSRLGIDKSLIFIDASGHKLSKFVHNMHPLDPKNQMEVLRVIREITTQASLATVMVIHDINLALRFCDRFLLMRNGDVIARGGLEAITAEALSTAYDMPMRIVDVDGIKMVVM